MTDKTIHTSETLAMTTGEWRLRLAELCGDCAVGLPEEEADLLRAAHDLVTMAPEAGAMGELTAHLPPRAHFEALLGLGAYDSAAIALVPESGSFILSRSGTGEALASVVLEGMEEELTSEAESPALALLSALMACLAEAAAGIAPSRIVEGAAQAKRGDAATRCGDVALDAACWERPKGVMLN
jgi:hypothetical protein